jgi:hypothetical protein
MANKAFLSLSENRVRQTPRSLLNPLVAGDFYRKITYLAFIGAST